MNAKAIAPANIAFIKYWGKRDAQLNLPTNDSISMNLSNARTVTEVEFSTDFRRDKFWLNGKKRDGNELEKVSRQLDRIAEQAGKKRLFAKVESENSFPTGSGIASSASGFAALTVAAASALQLELTEQELSILARQGSGSACRSIPDGFVKWNQGESDESSFAVSLFPPEYWLIHDLIAIVDENRKQMTSSEGHELAPTSPLFASRLEYLPGAIGEIERAFSQKDFTCFGEIIEAEALSMHAVMMTSQPSLLYWSSNTVALMQAIRQWRKEGVEAYFTIDAGPNVHIICEDKNAVTVKEKLLTFPGVGSVLDNLPTEGAKLI